jgi:large repetitive protein
MFNLLRWCRNQKRSGQKRRKNGCPRSVRPLVECLEERTVPSSTPSLLRTITYDQLTTPVSLQNDVVGNPGLGGEAKWASVLDASGNRAVVAASNGSINDVWTVDAAGNTTRIDSNVNGLVFLDISQNGSTVLEVINTGSGYDLRISNGNGGGQPQDIFTIPYDPGTGNNGGVFARLTADGKTIIFLTDAGVGPTLPSGSGVYSIPAATNQSPHLIIGKTILNSELASQLGGQTVGLLPASPFDMGISADGSHVVFAANTSNGGAALVAVDNNGNAHLIGPINSVNFEMPDIAISGDGNTVARYDTNTNPPVLSVYNFNGSAHSNSGPTLSVPGIPIDSTAPATISSEPIQLTFDGSKLLLGHTSLLLNTDGSGGFVQIGTNVPGTNFVGETFGQGPMTMNSSGNAFLFVGNDHSGNDELGIARLNPASPDPSDPQVSSPTFSTPYLVLGQPLNSPTLTITAPINAAGAPVVGAAQAFEQNGLSEDNSGSNNIFVDSQLYDDGTHGDVTAGDHDYTVNNINASHITDPNTDLGPRTIRLSGVALDSASKLHITTVEYTGLSIVSQAPTVNTTTAVVTSANPSFIDQPVTFTATVTAATGAAAPVGAVRFYIDGKPDQLVSLTAGTETSATATLVGHVFEQPGTFQVRAEYIPDPTTTFFESLGQLVTDQQVTLITTSTGVMSSLNPSTVGQAVTFTATVTAASGSPIPFDNGGSVQFQVGGVKFGTPQTLSGGSASITDSTLGVGANQSVTAIYSGDSDFSGSSGSLTNGQTVNGSTTGTSAAITSSKNPSNFGDLVTFTATVTPNSGTFDNGGSVQFVIDGSNYGSPVSLSGGTATTSDSALGVGNHSVEAIYSGDTAFTGSNGSLNGGQQVNAVATPPVLTPPSPQTVSEGVSIPINMGSFTDSSAGPWTLNVTNWGDGGQTGFVDLSSTGTLPSIYHPYAEEGTYSVTITVTNTSDNLSSSPETFQVTVSDPSVNAIGGLSMQSVEGSSTGQQMVASFSDPGGSESLGDYSASIKWGDNSTASAGTVSSLIGSVNVNIYSGHADTGSGAPFSGLVGSFTNQGIQFGASTGYNWHPLSQGSFGADITGTINTPAAGTYSFNLGSDDGSELFIDGNPVINDGGEHNFQSMSGSVFLTAGTHQLEVQFFNGSGGGGLDLNSYLVTGSHTFAEENSTGYTVATTIQHDQSTAVTVNDTAAVSDPAVVPTGVTLATVQGQSFSGTVATFTDPAGAEPNAADPGPVSNHYSATINWGDGSPSTSGVISGPDVNSTYTVTGTHQFSQASTTTSTVTLSSASALAAAMGPGVPSSAVQAELDAGSTTGLNFGPVLDGAYGSKVAVPPGAPAGTPVINIAPGDGESGFFETTFNLPSNVSGIQLTGSANVDDVGRVFVNGNAITPSIFSSAPGLITLSGNATFSTSNAAFFHAGVNTLLIAASNSGGGASGAAFVATVTYGAGSLPITVTIHHEQAPDATTTSTMTVNPAITITPSQSQLPNGTVGQAFSQTTIKATGGTGSKAMSYQVTAGMVPAGLSIVPNNGDPGTVVLSGTPTTAGTFSFQVTAVDIAGTTQQQSYTITIQKATPTIGWATPAAITYGTALSGTQLDANANVPGGYVYTPASGTVLGAGTQTLSVTFTPTDGADYSSTSKTVQLVVNKAHLSMKADNKTKTQGTTNPPLTFTLTGFVNRDTASVVSGSPTLRTTATTTSPVGTYPITVVNAGTLSAANYDFPAANFVNGTLTIDAAATAPTLTVKNVNAKEGTATALSITAALTGPVATETLSVQISGVPTGATFNHGTNLGRGVWSFSSSDLTGLTFTPPSTGTVPLSVKATATVTATSSTASTTKTLTVTVANVAPILTSFAGPLLVSVGSPLSFTAGFFDPGIFDTFTASIQWGAGAVTAGQVTDEPGTLPTGATGLVGTVTGSHTYTTAGTYSLTLTLTDKDGGKATFTWTVTVM